MLYDMSELGIKLAIFSSRLITMILRRMALIIIVIIMTIMQGPGDYDEENDSSADLRPKQRTSFAQHHFCALRLNAMFRSFHFLFHLHICAEVEIFPF